MWAAADIGTKMMDVMVFALVFTVMFMILITRLAKVARLLIADSQDIPPKSATKPPELIVLIAKENSMKKPLGELLGEVYFYAKLFRNSYFMAHGGSTCNAAFWREDLAKSRMQLESTLAIYRHELKKAALNK